MRHSPKTAQLRPLSPSIVATGYVGIVRFDILAYQLPTV